MGVGKLLFYYHSVERIAALSSCSLQAILKVMPILGVKFLNTLTYDYRRKENEWLQEEAQQTRLESVRQFFLELAMQKTLHNKLQQK